MKISTAITSLSIIVGLTAIPATSSAMTSGNPGQDDKQSVAEKDEDVQQAESDEQENREERPKRRGEGRGRWDTDGDGRMSAEEFPGPADRFAELDRNEDGFIDREEMPAGRGGGQRGRHGGNPMERFDADGDGKISRREFPGPDDRFDDLDRDGDGAISTDELPRRKRDRERRPEGS